MKIEFYGAAQEVTGSMHRLKIGGKSVLLDCGLFQGRRKEADKKNRRLPEWAAKADAVILSHAHLDHSGGLPSLIKHGFKGRIFATPATRDLCSVMLRDAAMIQESEARYFNRRQKELGLDRRIEPLYDLNDSLEALRRFVSIAQGTRFEVLPGVALTFYNAGHVLGSSLVCLDLEERGRRVRLLFSGDLGRAELPLLESPQVVSDVEVMLLESTYGDREHSAYESIDEELAEVISGTVERGGKVFIPSFALERAQEVLYALKRLQTKGMIPRVPVYLDSPLAISITDIYRLHPECLDRKVGKQIFGKEDPFAPYGFQTVNSAEESKLLQYNTEPAIILAGSGMCEGGRIIFHLAKGLENPRNSVVIVGFMAEHTLGRQLVSGKKKVRVLGLERDVRAQIHQFDGLSAHAGRSELVDYARKVAKAGPLRKVILVHGEPTPQQALAEHLRELAVFDVERPKPGDVLEL